MIRGDNKYIKCDDTDIPAGIRFDTPARHQGQMIEVSYGTLGRGEAGPGSPFKRVTDRSVFPPLVTIYRKGCVVK